MICPNCKNEGKPNAKFCAKCGFDLTTSTEVTEVKEEQLMCRTCGAPLKQGAKFCTKCGMAVEVQERAETAAPECAYEKIIVVHKSDMTSEAVQETEMEPKEAPESKETLKSEKVLKPKQDLQKLLKEKGNIIFFAVLILFVVGIAGVLMWRKIIPVSHQNAENLEMTDYEKALEERTEVMDMDKDMDININVDELFADVDAVVEEAKGKMDEDAEIVNVMDSLSSAVNDYMAKAEEAGDVRIAEDRAVDTYKVYIEAVEKHKEMMAASTLSGAIYAQVISELDAAFELGDALADNGYAIDLSELETSRSMFDSSYRQRIIETFDEFTTRDMWSRTESWNLMKDTDSMFDASDLDDPIRLRYAYALAWWTQKQIETELASGTITEKGAAVKIAGLLEPMDYNPMMISYYIQYMKSAGESCPSVESAYNEMVEYIRSTQGITLGSDIDLMHFWYFNDISDPSEGVKDGSVNGTTQENREWIRNRMEYAGFTS